jgi:CheY-like chemotaxis protein
LGDLETIFRTRTEEKNLQFLMERSELSSALICADQGKLRQVFVNLIGNAVKFTDKGGVAVRVRLEPHGTKEKGDSEALRLIAEVEDTGQGIPAGEVEKIFDAFYQAEIGLKEGGTGLGLAISRKFIEMMGGTLRVRSTVGRGSRFLFDVVVGLPDPLFAEQQAVVPRHIQGIAAGLGPYRVLLVDDVPANLVLLREMLGPIGFELKEACNGLEALEMFESWEPHAILMDMRMPIMDGYEASRIIKTSPRGALTYVIALTASAFEDYKEKVMETGVDLYMRKPFQTDELYDALAQGLGLHYTYTDDYEELHGEENWVTSESISYVPENWVQTLKEAVNEGDIAHVMELIHFLELEKPKMAKELQKLAEQFDYETLLERLRKIDESYG